MPGFRLLLIIAIIASILFITQAQVNIVEYHVVVDPINCSEAVTVYVPVALKEDGSVHEVMYSG